MTAKQTITFATFQELLPDSCNHPLKKQLRDKARYYGRKFLFKKQCDALVDFLNDNQTWIPLFQQNPYRPGSCFRSAYHNSKRPCCRRDILWTRMDFLNRNHAFLNIHLHKICHL